MTFADVLVSTATLGLVVATCLGALDGGQRIYALGTARVEAQQTARVALDRIAADVRAAGRGALATGFRAVSVAEPERLVLHVDVDADGRIAARGETITWRRAVDILRRDAGGGAQPVVNGLRALRFVYYDARGVPTAVPGDVRAVEVSVTTASDRPMSRPAAQVTATATTRVALRNR